MNAVARALSVGVAVGVSVFACSDSAGVDSPNPPSSAVITFAFEGRPQDTILVRFNNSAAIAQATSYISTHSGPKFPIGPIFRGAGVDARYPFHYDPDSVQLAEVAIELCDGRLMRTSAEVDAFMQAYTGDPNAARAVWCPWGAYPIRVVAVP